MGRNFQRRPRKAKRATAGILPVDIENVDELDFDEIDAIVLFKKKKYKFRKLHICVGTTSHILRNEAIVFYTDACLDLIHTSNLRREWYDRIRHTQNMSLNSALDKPVDPVGKVTL